MAKTRKASKVVLFCHQNADPDAVCSAISLQSLLQSYAPEVKIEVSCPGGISASTKQLLENLGYSEPSEKVPPDFDLAVLVDTNTLDQLGGAADSLFSAEVEIVVVDHHHPHPDTEKVASLMIVDESAAAAAEVVSNLALASKGVVNSQDASALLAAIFVETKHFVLARDSTFVTAARLVGAGADPARLADVLSSPLSRSERIARIRAASRGNIRLLGDWIVIVAELGSYQSSAARAFLGLGAHAAFVGGQTGGRVRVNMRSTEEFHRKTGVHLGRDVAIPLGKQLQGTGGGHPTAAGLSVPGDVKEVLVLCENTVREHLGPLLR